MIETAQYATGKRKYAVARAWLEPGTGDIQVNRKVLDQYFSRPAHQMQVRSPFEITGTTGQYNVRATIAGGGISGQAGALRHAIARALMLLNPPMRATLKKQGFLTRDPRVKERKKYGQKGARRRFQYSKR